MNNGSGSCRWCRKEHDTRVSKENYGNFSLKAGRRECSDHCFFRFSRMVWSHDKEEISGDGAVYSEIRKSCGKKAVFKSIYYSNRIPRSMTRAYSRAYEAFKRQFGFSISLMPMEIVFVYILFNEVKKFLQHEGRYKMDIGKITEEVSSPALQQIVASLSNVLDRVKSEEIDHKQATVEVSGHKHIIQSIALDWLYGGKKKQINNVIEKVSDKKQIN